MQRRDLLLGFLSASATHAVTRMAVAQPAPAGALPAALYLDMATKGGMFLENTARDAHAKTRNPSLKRFSRVEVNEQVDLAGKLGAATGRPPMAAGPAAAPFLAAGLAGSPPVPGMTTDAQKAQILAQLAAMPGGAQHDAMFVEASLRGHQEALAIHGSYAANGDDPTLRRIARNALPLIRLHIAQLSRMQGATQRQAG